MYEFPSKRLTKTFFGFKAFNELCKLGDCVHSADSSAEQLYVYAALSPNFGKRAVLFVNYSANSRLLKTGFAGKADSVFVIDEAYTYTELNYLLDKNGVLKMSPHFYILVKLK